MTEKDPVLLITLVDTAQMRWLVGAIGFDGRVYPLVRSQNNDLAPYQSMSFDEQASFLRHRFCGVLQRGCDRLWGISKKARHFIFVLDQNFPDAATDLTQRTADHLHQWMSSPPVTFLLSDGTLDGSRTIIAGQLDPETAQIFDNHFAKLVSLSDQLDQWEEAPPPKST